MKVNAATRMKTRRATHSSSMIEQEEERSSVVDIRESRKDI